MARVQVQVREQERATLEEERARAESERKAHQAAKRQERRARKKALESAKRAAGGDAREAASEAVSETEATAEDKAEGAAEAAKDEVEQAGLVKFDFLGLKTLTILDVAVRHINAQRSGAQDSAPAFRLEDVSLGDAKTYELMLWYDDPTPARVKNILTQSPVLAFADPRFATRAALPSRVKTAAPLPNS